MWLISTTPAARLLPPPIDVDGCAIFKRPLPPFILHATISLAHGFLQREGVVAFSLARASPLHALDVALLPTAWSLSR